MITTKKRLVAIVLCLAAIVSVLGITVFATGNETSIITTNECEVIRTSVTDELDDLSSHKIITFDEELSIDSLLNADVVTIDYADIEKLSASAKSIVDTGVMLYIVNPECSAEDIADMLSIPKVGITSYQKERLVAYSIYKIAESYVFSNHYVTIGIETNSNTSSEQPVDIEKNAPTTNKVSNFDNAITASETLIARNTIIPYDTNIMLKTALTSRRDVEESMSNINVSRNDAATRSTGLPNKMADAIWNDTLSVYGLNSTYYGYLNCTVYGYYIGRTTVNYELQNIYDVLSVVKAYPKSGFCVSTYKVQLSCNITDFSCLETTSLPSNISYTTQIDLTVKADATGLSGEVGATTSWTYNPESQIITESSSSPRIVAWTARTVLPEAGKAYDICPGMRIAAPIQYMKGAFSQIFCDAMILGISVNSNSIEVGGWF